ncbi:hypothetical protein F6Y05_39120 [Bacillus megaterium]|nr:hypothetical protein [Priestia megaterium]
MNIGARIIKTGLSVTLALIIANLLNMQPAVISAVAAGNCYSAFDYEILEIYKRSNRNECCRRLICYSRLLCIWYATNFYWHYSHFDNCR